MTATSSASDHSRALVEVSPTAETPEPPEPHSNPFPGPVPYRRQDEDYFRGRTTELEEITSLILSSSAVLIYGPSGAGKSSLLQAGVVPHLEQRFSFTVLPTARHLGVGVTESDRRAGSNRFTRAVTETLEDPGSGGAEYRTIAQAAAARRPNKGRVLLVLDQFEDVFARPELHDERDEFFKELTCSLEDNPWLRIVVVLRSDYLANLVPYEPHLPGNLAVRYAVDNLTGSQAREVIQESFEATHVNIDSEDVETLLDQLLPAAPPDAPRADYVNSIVLQILCRRLWEELSTRPPDSHGPVLRRGSSFSLQSTMVQFVDKAVSGASKQAHFDEGIVRRWLGHNLVTATGQRDIVLIGQRFTAGLPNTVLDALSYAKLVQIELRNDQRLAELTHDRMVAGVVESNTEWQHLRQRVRRRQSLALIVLFVVLIGLFPFLKEKSETVLADFTGNIQAGATLHLRFRAANAVAVVEFAEWSTDALRSKLGVKAEDGTSIVDQTPLHELQTGETDSTLTNPTVAFTTDRGVFYQIDVGPATSPSGYHITVSSIPLIFEHTDTAAGVSAARVGIPMERNVPVFVRVNDGDLSEVRGAQTLYWDDGNDEAVLLATRERQVAVLTLEDSLSTGAPRFANVSRTILRPVASIGTNEGAAPIRINGSASVSVVASSDGPSLAKVQCDGGYADLALIDSTLAPDGSGNGSFSGFPEILPMQLTRGRHRLLISAHSAGPENCQVRVRRIDRPALTGSRVFTLSPGLADQPTAYGLDPRQDAVVYLPEQHSVRAAILCADRGPDSPDEGSPLIAVIGPRDDCSLWLSRNYDYDSSKSSVKAIIAYLPSAAGRR